MKKLRKTVDSPYTFLHNVYMKSKHVGFTREDWKKIRELPELFEVNTESEAIRRAVRLAHRKLS